jgi:hypothetical protein
MSDANFVERVLQTCSYRCQTVTCPHQRNSTHIIAARWQTSDAHWRSWTVVDCPLLPAGEIGCDMSCLAQLESNS